MFGKLMAIACTVISLWGCKEKNSHELRFCTSPDYPPFEFKEGDKLTGFEIDLARAVAKELGKQATFREVPFSTVAVTVQSGMVDIGVSTLTITQERQRDFDFSEPYYQEHMAIVFLKDHPIHEASHMKGKKIGCQLGSTMEQWGRSNVPEAEYTTMDQAPQLIEALKAGLVDGVLLDQIQAEKFIQLNPSLDRARIGQSDNGYGFIFLKGSPLKKEIDKALQSLKQKGVIQQLREKYMGRGL